MAKASLNMLTRSIAESLAVRRVYVNSVDTGWITNEQPFETRQRMRTEHGFEPPLDAVDGAARVCDPIFRVALGEPPVFGAFLKDYQRTTW
jgi:NAD(P)-dependent dehydrogenase (short-subunit alcohol dehydrogenase family)